MSKFTDFKALYDKVNNLKKLKSLKMTCTVSDYLQYFKEMKDLQIEESFIDMILFDENT